MGELVGKVCGGCQADDILSVLLQLTLKHTSIIAPFTFLLNVSGVVWCGVVWCGVVWCGVVRWGVVWCGVVWRGEVWCGVV